MLIPGLVSVTFRKLSAEEIVRLVRKAGLKSIEWGGDIHVPHGDAAAAREVKKITTQEGLEVCCYGSYYRLGSDGLAFEKVLESAVELGSPLIRVWAGSAGSGDATDQMRECVTKDAAKVCAMAAKVRIEVALEYHARTLTDTNESAQRLVKDVPGIKLLWQPTPALSEDERLHGLGMALPVLANLHVYQWEGTTPLPLAQGMAVWRKYLAMARSTGRVHHCLLEFVRGDSPEAFLEDARTLLLLTQECF